jgi:hypothetical protein
VCAYDGSEDAQRSLTVARELLQAERAVVVHVRVLPLPPIIRADSQAGESGPPDDVLKGPRARVSTRRR